MIIEYYRPQSLNEAAALMARDNPKTYPLGGGTILNQPSLKEYAVVDLQDLELNRIDVSAKSIRIGATSTLQEIVDQDHIPDPLKTAIKHEANYNVRQVATIAGTIMAGQGRSPLITVLLAADSKVGFYPEEGAISLGNFLPFREKYMHKKIIRWIQIPMKMTLAYDYVARTPADLPIVCVSVRQLPSGRTRVALGGYGSSPILVFDGLEEVGADIAARDAYQEAGDQWASASYRSEISAILVKRCLDQIKSRD